MSGRKKELTPEELEARRLKKNERARQYYIAHMEKVRAQKRAWLKAHPDINREAQRAYVARNREKLNAYRRAYYHAHKEQYREYHLRAELKKYRKEKAEREERHEFIPNRQQN